MNKGPRNWKLRLTTLDLFAVTALSAAVVSTWLMDEYLGWIVLISSLYFLPTILIHFRLGWPLDEAAAILVPVCTVLLVTLALLFSMRHPPFLVGADWVPPPFGGFADRLGHALSLSFWQVIWAPFGLLLALFWTKLNTPTV